MIATENRGAPRSAARPVWLVLGGLLTVATVLWGTGQLLALLAHQEEHSTLVFRQPITAVETSHASVEFVATDSPEVTVSTHVSRGIQPTHHSERVDGATLVLRSSCSVPVFDNWCTVHYTVHVPADVTIHASASVGGIRATGIRGAMDLGSSGGGIHVDRASGPLKLGSSGGGITVTNSTSPTVEAGSSGGGVHLSFSAPPRDVTASSSGGGVTVELPDGPTTYRTSLGSSGGGTHVSVRTDPDSPNRISVHSSGGGVNVRYRQQG